MKTMNIAALKANLSKVLKAVQAGETVTVLDRDQPIAEIAAIKPADSDPWRRLVRQGRLKLGTQDWSKLKVSKLPKRVRIQQILKRVNEDLE
jgi:antitoxin (DNA-binding transcriptional repressor) of toxin-antitoxin stability system